MARNKIHVKKGDTVYVLTGKDREKKGKVLHVDSQNSRVIVEGINMGTKHKKPRSRNQTGGIIHQELPVHSSNLMVICPRCNTPAKMGRKMLENGQKVRICKKCNEIVDVIREAKE